MPSRLAQKPKNVTDYRNRLLAFTHSFIVLVTRIYHFINIYLSWVFTLRHYAFKNYILEVAVFNEPGAGGGAKICKICHTCTVILISNPKTTRVTAIRIFITPRKEQKVLKPLSSFIFIKNVCDRVREGEGEANGTKSIRIQFSTFPIPSPY